MEEILGKGKRLVAFVLLLSLVATSFVSGEGVYLAQAKGKMKLNKTSAKLYVGQSVTLKVKNNKKKVKWSSNHKKIAKVNTKGKVTGKSEGKAVITAKVGSKKLKCTVTVKTKNTTTTKATTTTQVATTTQANATEIKVTNTEGKDANDVAILSKIISEQNKAGAKLATDLNDTMYKWDK